jgi:1-deoxyxylulose-5-phosphate synthase
MLLLAWSAQAGGFFAGSTGEAARVYQQADNRERRARAAELGRRTGHGANAVALAWVLAQPFPVVAIIGPHSEEHLHASLVALEVRLGPEDARWLNLECER